MVLPIRFIVIGLFNLKKGLSIVINNGKPTGVFETRGGIWRRKNETVKMGLYR